MWRSCGNEAFSLIIFSPKEMSVDLAKLEVDSISLVKSTLDCYQADLKRDYEACDKGFSSERTGIPQIDKFMDPYNSMYDHVTRGDAENVFRFCFRQISESELNYQIYFSHSRTVDPKFSPGCDKMSFVGYCVVTKVTLPVPVEEPQPKASGWLSWMAGKPKEKEPTYVTTLSCSAVCHVQYFKEGKPLLDKYFVPFKFTKMATNTPGVKRRKPYDTELTENGDNLLIAEKFFGIGYAIYARRYSDFFLQLCTRIPPELDKFVSRDVDSEEIARYRAKFMFDELSVKPEGFSGARVLNPFSISGPVGVM